MEFDEQLKQRLIAFQTQQGLPANGIADAQTWQALVSGAHSQSAAAQETEGSADATAGSLLVSQIPLSGSPGPVTTPPTDPQLPPETFEWPQIPGEGFGEGLQGEIVVGGQSLGQGTYTATTGVATGGEVVAEGTLVVGEATLADGTALSGAAMVTGEAAVGLSLIPVIGVVVLLTGAVILIASMPPVAGAPEGDAGAELPGGVATDPMVDPGTPGPAAAPGQVGTGPATAPGQPGGSAVEDPGIVDDPMKCAKLNQAGSRHQHHIFPLEYVHEFDALDIEVDDYTVWLDHDQHIGPNGIHTVFDWNGEWADFFHDVPNDLTRELIEYWQRKAIELATDLLNRAGIAHKPIVPYRKR
jgi:hypothetical protein